MRARSTSRRSGLFVVENQSVIHADQQSGVPDMAQPPMAAASAAPDPMAASGAPDAGGAPDQSGTVVVTIVDNGDGTYTVYPGDEPDGDDQGAADAGGAPAAPQGQSADSVGAALKAAMDIMNAAKSSSGAPGSAEDQFQAGYSGDQSAAPAGGMAQKY